MAATEAEWSSRAADKNCAPESGDEQHTERTSNSSLSYVQDDNKMKTDSTSARHIKGQVSNSVLEATHIGCEMENAENQPYRAENVQKDSATDRVGEVRTNRRHEQIVHDSDTGCGEKDNSSDNGKHIGSLNQPEQSNCTDEKTRNVSSPDSAEAADSSSETSAVQKSHLPNFLQVESATTGSIGVPSNPNLASLVTNVTGKRSKGDEQLSLKVKTEPQDDIKEYAETTMNELLGWYGLSKMDKTDTTRLTLNNAYPKSIIGDTPMPLRDQICAKMSSVEDLRAASAISTKASVNTSIADIATESTEPASPAQKSRMLESPSQTQPPVAMDKSGSSVKKAISTTALSMLPARNPPSENARENSRGRSRKENLCATADKLATEMTSEPSNDTNNNSNGFGGPDGSDEEDFAEDDENDDDDMSDEISNLASPDVGPSDVGSAIVCSWCEKDGTKLFTLDTSAGVKAFCSEMCFTQCRRASFKKSVNKVCDWCKHLRYTVNFVELQEGDVQLQFCTEKCLNQYKMNIFCTEARQHLEHMQKMTGDGESDVTRSKESKGEILITPELWLSGTSSGVREVKKEKQDICDGDHAGDKGEMDNEEEEKEPGEVREKENPGNPLRIAMRDTPLDQQRKATFSNYNYIICDKETQSKNDKLQKEGNEPSLSSHKNRHRSISGGSSRDSARVLVSPIVPPLASNTGAEPHGRNQRRSRERIRRLLVGEPVDRPCSPQGDGHDNASSPHRYPHVDAGALRGNPTSTATAMLPEQQLLGHPMLQHWATSQLLAMLPSMQSSLPASLAPPSAAAHLASLGYAANSSQLIYPALFGAAPLRPPNADEPAAGQGQRGNAANTQIRGSNAFRSESTPVCLPSRNPAGDGCGNVNNRRSTNPSPLSPSTSHSSCDTHVPPSVLPTPPLAPDFLQLVTGTGGLASREDTRALQSYLAAHARLPPVIPSLPVQTQHFPRPTSYPHDTSGVNLEAAHHFAPRNQSNDRAEDNASRHPSHPPQGQQNTPHILPPPFPQSAGVPPVTVLVPYPVAVPIPIPVPIPLPISPEKLFAFFEERSKSTNASQAAGRGNAHNSNPRSSRQRSQSSSSSGSKMSGSSPRVVSPAAPRYPGWGITPSSNRATSSASSSSSRGDQNLVVPGEHDDASDSITMLRREVGKPALLVPPDFPVSPSLTAVPLSLKRSAHSSPHQLQLQTLSIDLSKRARNNSPSGSQEGEAEAMDLRKTSSRSTSPLDAQSCASSGTFGIGASIDSRPLSGGGTVALSDSPAAQGKLLPPRIHIVLNEQPSLNAASEMNGISAPFSASLPPVPDQSTYSSRRSRILDAPSIPRKTPRSPSPERRYVRTVPRDMVEAARRRGLRARVRTK